MTITRHKWIAGLLVVGVSLLLFGQGLTTPFQHDHQGWNCSFYGIAARNYLRYGYTELGLMHCIEAGSLADDPYMYLRHPPLCSLLASGFVWALGDSELSLRLAPYLLSTASALLLFLWMARVYSDRPWLAAGVAICAVSTPLWATYGNMLEPLGSGVIFSFVGALYFADRWLSSNSRIDLTMILAFLMFGFLWDWAAFYTAGCLGLIFWIAKGRGGWRTAGMIWAYALMCGFLLILWILIAGRSNEMSTAKLAQVAGHRMGWLGQVRDDFGNPISLSDIAWRVAELHWKRFYSFVSIGGIISAVIILVASMCVRFNARTALLMVPMVVACVHILIFPQGAYVHDYWQVYLAVGLPIPLFAVIAHLSRHDLTAFSDVLSLGLTTILAVATLTGAGKWMSRDHDRPDYREQASELSSRTDPDEVILGRDLYCIPPMLQYYSDRKVRTGYGDGRQLSRGIVDRSGLHGPIGGFLVPKTEVAPYLPTLRALEKEQGWTGPFEIGEQLFWDARP